MVVFSQGLVSRTYAMTFGEGKALYDGERDAWGHYGVTMPPPLVCTPYGLIRF